MSTIALDPMPAIPAIVAAAVQPADLLLLAGDDCADFLHRMCTQHTTDMAPGDARPASFCTDKGKLVATGLVLCLPTENVGLPDVDGAAPTFAIALDMGSPATLLDWLENYLFVEDVELAVAPATAWTVLGPTADLPGAAWPVANVVDAGAVRSGALVWRRDDLVAHGEAETHVPLAFMWTWDEARTTPLTALPTVALEAYHTWRIHTGLPAPAPAGTTEPVGELVTSAGPLDLDLHRGLHWAKGCYIGQEVIARLDTYAKSRRRLYGLACDTAAPLVAGDPVRLGKRLVGRVTSVAPVRVPGAPQALVLAKLPVGTGLDADFTLGEGTTPCHLVERACAQVASDSPSESA